MIEAMVIVAMMIMLLFDAHRSLLFLSLFFKVKDIFFYPKNGVALSPEKKCRRANARFFFNARRPRCCSRDQAFHLLFLLFLLVAR